MIKVQADDYIIRSRREAEDVLNKLIDHAARIGTVSIGDYYDLIGVPTSYQNYGFGWSFNDISKATIHGYHEYKNQGVYIKLPPAEAIGMGRMKDELKGIIKEAITTNKRISVEKHDILESKEHGYCLVLNVAAHSETNQNMVVYQVLENKEVLVTPLEMFTADKFKVAFNVKALNGLVE